MVSLQLKANGYINKRKGDFGTHLHSAFQHMSTMQHAKKTLYIKYHTVILTYCIRRISDKWTNVPFATTLYFHFTRWDQRGSTHTPASRWHCLPHKVKTKTWLSEIFSQRMRSPLRKYRPKLQKKDIEKPHEIHETCSSWHLSNISCLSNLSDLSDCFERAHIFKTKLSAFAAAFGLEATGGRDTTSPKQCLPRVQQVTSTFASFAGAAGVVTGLALQESFKEKATSKLKTSKNASLQQVYETPLKDFLPNFCWLPCLVSWKPTEGNLVASSR